MRTDARKRAGLKVCFAGFEDDVASIRMFYSMSNHMIHPIRKVVSKYHIIIESNVLMVPLIPTYRYGLHTLGIQGALSEGALVRFRL